ncbi:Gfo/Idh/MocA family oxidoreductase [Pseudopedobacter beijingensis]|uniref:Gfo/Idh/MocA family oxidoreductase n=1 Tax=Pseudopedobacter beijingensis TaxID=1207056 RepID=A0ABW4I9K2_9SPHI
MKPIKTGLLAYGMSGKVFHAPFIEQHPDFELTSIVERSKDQAIKDYPNIKHLKEIDDLLADESIELVIVNTPNFTHYQLAKEALNAGKHVLIEKPMSVLRREAEDLFALAYRKNLKIMVYQNRRFNSDFLSVSEVLNSGRLGKIVEVHFRFDRYRTAIGPKYFKENPMPGSGILYDLGAHLIDQAISLFGMPLDFIKTYGCNRPDSQVDDYANVHLKYKNGLNVYLTANLLVADEGPAYIIHGTQGTYSKGKTDVQEDQLLAGMKPLDKGFGIEKEGSEGRLVTIDENNEKQVEAIKAPLGNYMGLFDEVSATIRQDKDYFVKQQEILAQIDVLEK